MLKNALCLGFFTLVLHASFYEKLFLFHFFLFYCMMEFRDHTIIILWSSYHSYHVTSEIPVFLWSDLSWSHRSNPYKLVKMHRIEFHSTIIWEKFGVFCNLWTVWPMFSYCQLHIHTLKLALLLMSFTLLKYYICTLPPLMWHCL